jgi:hypothetical protein
MVKFRSPAPGSASCWSMGSRTLRSARAGSSRCRASVHLRPGPVVRQPDQGELRRGDGRAIGRGYLIRGVRRVSGVRNGDGYRVPKPSRPARGWARRRGP